MPKKPAPRKKLTRQQKRDLDIEISFLEGVTRRDPAYVDALQVLGDDYTRRGNLTQGLQVDQQLAALKPQDALVHYNLACSYALTNQPSAACDALLKSLQLGYSDFKWLEQDPDLAALRAASDFRLVEQYIRTLKIPVS